MSRPRPPIRRPHRSLQKPYGCVLVWSFLGKDGIAVSVLNTELRLVEELMLQESAGENLVNNMNYRSQFPSTFQSYLRSIRVVFRSLVGVRNNIGLCLCGHSEEFVGSPF